MIKFKEIKNWSPEVEQEITTEWKKSNQFKFNKNAKKIYSIDTPPPYINAPIHMGHAVTYAYQDFFARWKRLKGFEVLFPLGLDRNGLPIEMAAEKKYNTTPHKIGREKFIELCEQMLKETSTESTDTFAKLGISFNSYEEGEEIGAVYLTDSPEYRRITQATFISLFKKGQIYEDTRINNWDPKLQTTIADSEITYEDIPSKFNYVKWKIKETGETIIIGTTRPELTCTCGAVIVHPDDERYKHLHGKHAISPIFEKEIPIVAHHYANPEKATGIVMMCSVGDLTDIQFFREMQIKPVIAIEKNGTMNEHAGFMQGLKVKEARQKIIEELKNKGLIEKQEHITHRTPISERSNAEIEFIEMPEFYLKQLEAKEDVAKIAEKIKFYPTEAKKILDDWIKAISIDWPISRRRYYATPIPLWHAKELVVVPKEGPYYVPWKEQPPADAEVYKNGKKIGKVSEFNEQWEGETRVLDTWFDSSISELNVIHYKKDPEFFKKAYPVTLRPQGKEIVRTWLYYTLLRGYLETGKQSFEDVWIHQHITDAQGRKMSKSAGNTIDPQKLIQKHGAEALRLWSATEGNLAKQDLRCTEQKIQAELKTVNKLMNVTRFVLQFEKPKKAKLTRLDEVFIQYIDYITEFADKNYEEYEFHQPTLKLRNFLWETFASHYIEIIKYRAYNRENEFSQEESDAAKYTAYYLLERLITLLYPVIPQATTIIAEEIKLKFKLPKLKKTEDNSEMINKIIEFNKNIWKQKKDKNLALNQPLEGITIPSELKEFEKDLKACHKI